MSLEVVSVAWDRTTNVLAAQLTGHPTPLAPHTGDEPMERERPMHTSQESALLHHQRLDLLQLKKNTVRFCFN